MNHSPRSKETLAQSVGFSALGTLADKAATLLGFLILARLLSPNEFGLLAIASIFTSFSMIFIEMGMGASLIYKHDATEKHFASVFWFNLCIALILCLVMMLLAPYAANFLDEPAATSVIVVAAALLPINALSLVPQCILQKGRHFRRIAKVEAISTISGIILAVILARAGFGIWALIANLFARASLRVLLVFRASGWRPIGFYSQREFNELWPYSRFLLLSSAIDYVAEYTDRILIAKNFSSSSLGNYDYANRLTILPSNVIVAVFGRVLFPTYTATDMSAGSTKSLHLKVLSIVAFITFPFMLLISALADQFVLAVIGEKWLGAIFALKMFGLIYLFRTIGAVNGTLCISQGATKLQFKLTLFMRVIVVVAIVIGIQFGVSGLLVALLIARVINFFPANYFPGKLVDISFPETLRSLMPAFVASGLAYLSVTQLKALIPHDAASLLALMAAVLIYAAVYFVSFAILDRDQLALYAAQARGGLKR